MLSKRIILASNSPRRKELLRQLDLDYEVRVIDGIDESYPSTLPASEVAEYIARKKAAAYIIGDDELLITADTIVVIGTTILGKPIDLDDARQMLRTLSGRTHQVVTGCCLTTKEWQKHFSVTTDVSFKVLSDSEIDYYVSRYKPLDKAGAYGVQEWIGSVGVTELRGSYFNVMGFPVQRIYEVLLESGVACQR